MALVYRADLTPTKLELLAGFLPTRSWYPGPPAPELERVAAYRFDDPAGAVGIETLLVRAGDGPVLQCPLTYRDAPLDGAEQWLLGTSEHSVLGRRWIYDGCGDPVYAAVLATTILAGGTQAEEFVQGDNGPVRRDPDMYVTGSGQQADFATEITPVTVADGDPVLVRTGAVELTVARILDRADGGYGLGNAAGAAVLSCDWSGSPTPVVLATARRL